MIELLDFFIWKPPWMNEMVMMKKKKCRLWINLDTSSVPLHMKEIDVRMGNREGRLHAFYSSGDRDFSRRLG